MKNLRYFVFSFLLIPIFLSCQSTKLNAKLTNEVNFKADDGSIFLAEFYSLEDNSLYFVKLSRLADDNFAEKSENFVAETGNLKLEGENFAELNEIFAQKSVTLTRAISASGERYVDETGKIEFLLKGNEATLSF